MTRERKRTPAETWDALEKMALEDEVDRVLELSDKELDQELKSAGLDAAAVRERGRQIGERLEGGSREPVDAGAWVSEPPLPARVSRFSRRSMWLVAAALAALVGGGVSVAAGLFSNHEPPPPRDKPDAGPKVEPTPPPGAPNAAPAPVHLPPEDKPKPRP